LFINLNIIATHQLVSLKKRHIKIQLEVVQSAVLENNDNKIFPISSNHIRDANIMVENSILMKFNELYMLALKSQDDLIL
jgi:hypothetical protein